MARQLASLDKFLSHTNPLPSALLTETRVHGPRMTIIHEGMTTMFDETMKAIGQFTAAYEIGTGALGAPNFRIEITVNTINKTINGTGEITQPVNPPLLVQTRLYGMYMPMATTPTARPHILIAATGTPAITLLPVGIRSLLAPNVYLFMALAPDGKTGRASYKYKGPKGQWVEVTDVPVKRV